MTDIRDLLVNINSVDCGGVHVSQDRTTEGPVIQIGQSYSGPTVRSALEAQAVIDGIYIIGQSIGWHLHRQVIDREEMFNGVFEGEADTETTDRCETDDVEGEAGRDHDHEQNDVTNSYPTNPPSQH